MAVVPLSPRLRTVGAMRLATKTLRSAARQGEIVLALVIMAIFAGLILPMPAFILDIFLVMSLSLSVVVIMTTLFIKRPLEMNSFPTILLISTLIRLALNVASTRLILSHGFNGTDAAGHVIQAFGKLVMQGNFIVGIVIFAILVIVNFVVITKGSSRIAEVAARFTLDAVPGKQMSIDADLAAGYIDETEAKKRRKELEDESQFFGSMDGAAKFVRGDAMAGLIIVFINIIGGILIGVLQHDMTFGQANPDLHPADGWRWFGDADSGLYHLDGGGFDCDQVGDDRHGGQGSVLAAWGSAGAGDGGWGYGGLESDAWPALCSLYAPVVDYGGACLSGL